MRAAGPQRRVSRRAAVVSFALAFAVTTLAASAEDGVARRRAAVRAIDQCLPRLDAGLDVGRARIEARCPGALQAIEASPVAANLPRDWQQARNELSAGGLRALRRALADPPPAARRTLPDAAALAQLAQAARAGLEPGGGPWARFSRWLRSLLERGAPRRDLDDPVAGWLRGLSLPQRAWTLFGYLVLAGLLLFVAWLVRAELRAAGLAGRARAPRAAPGPAWPETTAERYDSLPLEERPAWLLRQLAAQLQRRGCLQAAATLTARELAQRARLDSPQETASLRELAGVAERVRYDARPPAAPEIEPVLAPARALLQRLESPRAGAS